MALNPHEHRMWAVIGMYGGQEDNAFYRRASGGLEPAGGRELPAGDVLVMGDDWEGRFDEFSDVCKVVYVPRTPAISTTALIEKISGGA